MSTGEQAVLVTAVALIVSVIAMMMRTVVTLHVTAVLVKEMHGDIEKLEDRVAAIERGRRHHV